MPLTMSLSSSHRLRLGVAAGASAAFVLLAGPAAAQESEEPDYEIDDTYTIEQGESLSAVADEYEIDDWVVLYAVNADEIANPDVVLVGQEIDVPADPDAVDVDAVELPGAAASSASGGGAAETTSTGGSAPESASEPAPQPAPQPAPAAESASGSTWDRLAQCESNGNWSTNTGNGFYGGLQFHPQTWAAHGGHQYAPNAHQASRSQEIAVAERVKASQGWGAWPSCSSQLGLR